MGLLVWVLLAQVALQRVPQLEAQATVVACVRLVRVEHAVVIPKLVLLHKGAAANAASKDLPTGVLQHVAAQRFPRGEHLLADSAAVLSFAQVSVFVLLQVTLLEELLCASQSQPVVTR